MAFRGGALIPPAKYISPSLLPGIASRVSDPVTMKNTSKNIGTGNNATAALAKINAQIEALQQQRVGLAQPLKDRYAELRGELLTLETEVRELDPTWKPEPMKAKAETKIAEILTANSQPMTPEAITKAVGDLFTPWKIKNTLKKKSSGAKAVFTFADGKYNLKATV